MKLRAITCWTVYNPKRKAIVTGHRTKKDLKLWYPCGIPIRCVVVKMKGQYLPSQPQSHEGN